MIYRQDKYGRPISLLGYGCMRFTRKGRSIDVEKAAQEVLAAVEGGVNYFDTAYLYSGSEEALGTIVEKYGLRDKINIATKLPQYLVRNAAGIDKYFDESMSRLKTDRIDYFLFHFVTSLSQWERLKTMDIENWIAKKKQSGEIRNIGFSYHGNTEEFIKVLNAYDWDFCQIQYNYVDENSQAGRDGLRAAAEKGIPVVIMEPLRGGKLVNQLPAKAVQCLKESPAGYSPAEIGLRWLYDQPEVTCVLSGMNSLEMVRENCRVASEADAGCLTEEDREIIQKIKGFIAESEKVGCTGCRYCMPCPAGVDIPLTFQCYNQMAVGKKFATRFEYYQAAGLREKTGFPGNCIGCGKCEQHCPQSLPIRQKLKEAEKALLPGPYKLGVTIARKFLLKK